MLKSRLFRDSKALQSCAVADSAHITPGTKGEHVQLVQRALVLLGLGGIPASEYRSATYGPKTAAAVLAYKQARKIINFSYQKQADNIVGKMTVTALDKEVCAAQDAPDRNDILLAR
jgi:peptidoglycan hydrolase-like protein with peptidoglycan-binding domain